MPQPLRNISKRSQIFAQLNTIDNLILRTNTGTPFELAKKLRVSERCARKYIDILKSLGAPIAFCRKRKSYYYQQEGSFNFYFTSFSPLTTETPESNTSAVV